MRHTIRLELVEDSDLDTFIDDFVLGMQQAGFVTEKCESEILFYRRGNHKMQTTANRLLALSDEQSAETTVAATIAVYDRHSDEDGEG